MVFGFWKINLLGPHKVIDPLKGKREGRDKLHLGDKGGWQLKEGIRNSSWEEVTPSLMVSRKQPD